ncbi:MAG: response regulator [Pseudobacteriovorax sp.]|nr:response regulator [Pseudobacteriovorax sp.]
MAQTTESNPPHILVVEDSEIQRKLFEKRLENSGYRVSSAGCGEDAIEMVKNEGPHDLVILDLNMPGMNGVEVLNHIRPTHSSIELPVIMLTAEDEEEIILDCLTAGANDFINKSTAYKISLRRIQTQLELKKMAAFDAKAKEIKALSAMIITYNHQINNPLTIAMGNLGNSYESFNEDKFEKTKQSLLRIKDIVIEIKKIDVENVEYASYAANASMLKIGE